MNLFSYIKQHISILEVISEYATLKKAGVYYKGVCPFHHEKTASFTVSPHKEIFYCFGCHSGGDVISFIQKTEQCSPLEAAHFLADRFHLDIPDTVKQYQKQDTSSQNAEKKQYHALCKLTAQWSHELLLKSPAVLRYLKNRSINNDIIQAFTIGYFPGGLSSIKQLIANAAQHGFLVENLLDAYILAQGKSVLYSPFEDRIIFPIKDHLGRTCGFGGRVYKKTDDRPKYYNSKENSFFSKGSLLFGLDRAKHHIAQTGSVFLVEGYTDCVAMAQYGYHNTVATLGTACTREHLKVLSRYAQHLFILYDGDKAGTKAVLRLSELCWNVDLELKVLTLPAGEDPASFLLKYGSIETLLESAQDIFIFMIESTAQDFSQMNLHEKVTAVRSVLATIEALSDSLKQELLLSRAAKSLDIPLTSLKRELKRVNPSKSHHQIDETKEKSTEVARPINLLKEIPLLEKKLFSVIINNVHLVHPEDKEYLLEYLSTPMQELLKKIEKIKGDAGQLDFAHFFDTLQEHEKLLVSHLVLEGHEYEGSENLEYLLTEFQKKTWKSCVANTKLKLERAKQAHDIPATKKILNQFQHLKKKLLRKGLI